jgi:inhibitor of KinA
VKPVVSEAGDQAFLIRVGEGIDPAVGDGVLALLGRLDEERPPGVTDVVPGYATLLVIHDGDHRQVRTWIERTIEDLGARPVAPPAARLVAIPVLYDPRVAPDLVPLAAEKGLTVAELVALHTAPRYRCYVLGFRPGFPFLGGLDPRLRASRLPTPRLRVPAGSVGIGGEQTGVYSVESPGGWRIVGRTPLCLFNPTAADPFLVHPGDSVVFYPVDADRFLALGGALDARRDAPVVG